MKRILVLFLLAILNQATMMASDDVALTAKNEGCTEFYDAIVATGIYEHAKKKPEENGSFAPFTVFAPTNEAFSALKGFDLEKKKDILKLHVVPGKKITSPSDEMSDGVPTVGKHPLYSKEGKIALDGGTTKASIVKGPIEADNGLVYIIDAVLLPAGEQPAKPEQKSAVKTEEKAEQKEPAKVEHKAAAPAITQASISEQTAQALVTSVAQLTQSIQLLIHVIQQAQAASETPPSSTPAKTA